jgi:hypothetical protein
MYLMISHFRHMSNLPGHNKRLLIPFCRSSFRKECTYFTFRFLREWDNLPFNTISTNVTKTFMRYEYFHKLSILMLFYCNCSC